jgi:flavin-dependent dehydrogenase
MTLSSDIVIVGAGPTGCALGTYLARRGAKVTLVESVERPESVVGESMLPGATLVFEECGLDLTGFLVKRGAVFCQDGRSVRFDFSEAEAVRYPHAWQVQREVFDLRWRDVARRHGCSIVYTDATAVDIPGRTLDTSAGPLRADRIIDAGGRSMWLSRTLGLRVGDPRLKNSAVGTRCKGVVQLAPDEPGDITICCIPGGWIWIIPFGGGLASTGVVMSPACPLRGTAEERFKAAIEMSPDAKARLAHAERVLPYRGLQDFTATSTAFHGDGFALCGDAATFIDPVFSSGVLLGLHGARQLAAALDGGDLDAEGAAVFRKVIDHWYAGDFMELALAPPPLQKPYYRTGIVSLLAGDVYNPTRRTPREMAERMGELAGLVREYNERPAASSRQPETAAR